LGYEKEENKDELTPYLASRFVKEGDEFVRKVRAEPKRKEKERKGKERQGERETL